MGCEFPVDDLVDVGAGPGCHGVHAEARDLPEHDAAAATVVDAVQAVDPDLPVCGADGRGRVRDRVPGGFTHDVAADCPLPCLMIH